MLGVTIQINDRVLAFYEIRRVKPVDTHPMPSTICEYKVFDEEGNQILAEHVKHRFGKGANALVFKVLGKLERLNRRTKDETPVGSQGR